MTLYAETAALAACLYDSKPLRALVKSNIFPVVAPRGASGSLPIVVYRNAGRVSPESKDGGASRSFEVRLASTEYGMTQRVADAVVLALHECDEPDAELAAIDEAFDVEEERYVTTLVFTIN